ncbi:MAG: ADP-ribosylglycohydrolase family protein [Verrucomicrobia bacterium]|nr:ADP-ribosylglycohydrolase family protein [Verrucomicrobiota bacterium]
MVDFPILGSQSYVERAYAGILGKIIGVYLGRPIEGWTHQQIQAGLGEIWYYVHDRLNVPLVVTDDDLSGTFTFVRALADYGLQRSISAEQIGRTWLNYIIENKSILWWGGFGNSTEHTAFLRLKSGVPAPRSGSMALNGKVVAEQIGAQIFIDGWALAAPGDPVLAAELAGKAASVSHDGEAVNAARLLAVMEAQAFIEPRLDQLLETGLGYVPTDSLIHELVNDVRDWSAQDGDWRLTRERIERTYGYDKFGGNCHVVPNHAVIILSLLYGEDSFHRALMIACTSGWDTDCNAGNVGCLMGIKNGLPGIEDGPDFRSPVADRLYLSTADGGRCITDAVRETYEICRSGCGLKGIEPVQSPKQGARFHFELPGAIQGFEAETTAAAPNLVRLRNVPGHSRDGRRSLAWEFHHLAKGAHARVSTPTFIPPDARGTSHYALMACPTLFPGQRVRSRLEADPRNSRPVQVSPFVAFYDGQDQLKCRYGPEAMIDPGASHETEWMIDELGGAPIGRFGFELAAASCAEGTLYLDYIDWKGTPTTVFRRPDIGGGMWHRAWVNAFDDAGTRWPAAFHLSQGRGTGLFVQGSRDWRDYRVQATVTARIARSFGLAARVQGLLRYYALLLGPGPQLRLVRFFDSERELAGRSFAWDWERPYTLGLEVTGTNLVGWVNGEEVFSFEDVDAPLSDGGVAFVCEEGLITSDALEVRSREANGR